MTNLKLFREALKHVAALIIFDAVEYPVVDLTVDLATKSALLKFIIVPDVLEVVVDG